MHELLGIKGYADTIELENEGNMGHDLKIISFECIVNATRNFSSENKLGEGGFGPVYKVQTLVCSIHPLLLFRVLIPDSSKYTLHLSSL